MIACSKSVETIWDFCLLSKSSVITTEQIIPPPCRYLHYFDKNAQSKSSQSVTSILSFCARYKIILGITTPCHSEDLPFFFWEMPPHLVSKMQPSLSAITHQSLVSVAWNCQAPGKPQKGLVNCILFGGSNVNHLDLFSSNIKALKLSNTSLMWKQNPKQIYISGSKISFFRVFSTSKYSVQWKQQDKVKTSGRKRQITQSCLGGWESDWRFRARWKDTPFKQSF